MAEETSTTPDRILRKSEVLARTGLSRTSMYRLAQEGKFPRPLKLGARASGWLESEVSAWMFQKAAERDAGQGVAA